MKLFRAFLVLFLLTGGGLAHAQVAMEIKMSQQNYLQYEPVFVRVGFRNMGAQPLAFGETDALRGALTFEITPLNKAPEFVSLLDKKNLPKITGNILPSGGIKNIAVPITNYYDVRKIGRYAIKAVISHPLLQEKYESNTEYFTVQNGTTIWKTTVGLPDMTEREVDASGKPRADQITKIQTRDYRIVLYDTGTVRCYNLIIEDKDRVYKNKRIGFDMGSDLKPKCEIDFLSRISLLVAASHNVFAYYQYNTDGKLEKKQVYIKLEGSTPRLVLDEENGLVMPVGGRVARKDVDYEEIKDIPFMEKMDDFNTIHLATESRPLSSEEED